jgi:hypothetical protein
MNDDLKAEFNTDKSTDKELFIEIIRLLRKLAGEYPK